MEVRFSLIRLSAFMNPKILVADDEPDVLNLVAANLRSAGFDVLLVEDGPAALAAVRKQAPQLLVLDLMLPGMSGLEICRTLKGDPSTVGIPIVMLTAKAEEVDRIVGLELGADDYVTKPFSPRELVLRVKSVLRRSVKNEAPGALLTLGGIVVDRERFLVTVAGTPVDFTATELKLLTLLMERRGRVQSREVLLNDVWGYESVIDTRTVDTHVRRLREKLGTAADCLETVRGFGYRIAE
jgi:two-component system phosphate regulon response regulator PhoB